MLLSHQAKRNEANDANSESVIPCVAPYYPPTREGAYRTRKSISFTAQSGTKPRYILAY